MFNLETFFTPIALWLGLIAPPALPPSEPPTATILCYHTFDSRKVSAYSVDSAVFDEQMRYLMVQHIPVISLADLVAHLREGKPIPDHSVVITIDDGYKSARTIAWPILQKYGFPFTLYIYPTAISHLRAYMTWEDLRYLSYMGVDIESHTLTHPVLTNPGKVMNPKDYIAWLDKELHDSRQILEFELQKPVRHLAYSYGVYNEEVVDHARAAGYWSATTCNAANVTRHTKPLMLDRRLIFNRTTPGQFVTLLKVRELTLTKQAPRDGQYMADLPKEIQAQILNRDQIAPGSLKIRMDHLRGWHSVLYDPVTGLVRFSIPRVAYRGYFYITINASDRDNPSISRQATWLFITRKEHVKSKRFNHTALRKV